MAQEQTSGCGQAYLIATPVEECRTKLMFQLLNVFGNGGLGHEEFGRSFREAEPLSNGVKDSQAKVEHETNARTQQQRKR
jgi:hypothetical protein